MTPVGWIAVSLAAAAYVPYLRSVFTGEARPNRASWWIFSATGLFAAAASWAGGARDGIGVPLVYGVLSLAVALAAIRRGEGGWNALDLSCLGLAAASLVVWGVSGDPLLCVWMNVVADTAGHVPTMVKAWRDPQREPLPMWLVVVAADVLNLSQIRSWTLIEVLYPISLTANAGAVVCARLLGSARLRTARPPA